ncbi:MAG: dihydrolipoamide acetyltransferase family protein [Chloroflexota bacterium]
MPAEVVMPRLGWDMKLGSVAEWLKRDGDQVEMGEPICMIAGDKATTELEALDAGILRIPPQSPEPGQEVPVGTVLAYLVAPGEEFAPEPSPTAAAAAADSARAADGAVADTETGADTGGHADLTGKREASAGDEARSGDADGAEHTERGGATAERAGSVVGSDYAGTQSGVRADGDRRIVASPRARRAAASMGVDWRMLVGSGRGGRVLERDVQHAAAQTDPSPAAGTPSASAAGTQTGPGVPAARAPAVVAQSAETAAPLQGVRRLTAERMALSARSVAPVTLTTEADATSLVRLREQAHAEQGSSGVRVPGYTDFMVRLVALALTEQPALNAELTEAGIIQHAHVNVGIAVDTPRGLYVPVVRNAASVSVEAISRESARLIGAAREGKSRPEDLEGATFTVTNLGMFDVDAFTPIVTLPQCAVLGLGRIIARPVVVDEATEQVAVRRMFTLSLTFDHRLVDGAPAARFLQRVKHFVERPTLWLFR